MYQKKKKTNNRPGGRQLDRPAGGQRAHPGQLARRLEAAGGAAAGKDTAGEEGQPDGRVQRLLLLSRLAGHRRGGVLEQAAAVPRQPGLRFQGWFDLFVEVKKNRSIAAVQSSVFFILHY